VVLNGTSGVAPQAINGRHLVGRPAAASFLLSGGAERALRSVRLWKVRHSPRGGAARLRRKPAAVQVPDPRRYLRAVAVPNARWRARFMRRPD